MHDGHISVTPAQVRRRIGEAEVDALRMALEPVLPRLAVAPVREAKVCVFTNTPDQHFIIDRHPRFANVFVSSACSGHGFKFASAIGEAQAEMMISGASAVDVSPFRLDRFAPR
jgi:sarcosine oxidase/N-methyl-L-tryptophan oxidase